MITVDKHVARLLNRIGDDQEVQILARNSPFHQLSRGDPIEQSLPVCSAKQNDRESMDFARLDERQRLKQFVKGAKSPGKNDETGGEFDKHRLPHEKVAEVDAQVREWVAALFKWQLDVEPDRMAAGLLGS